MTIRKQMDCVRQKVTLVVNARQTDLAQDASGDSVVSRTKRAKPARHPRPVTEDVPVLFVGEVFFTFVFGTPLALRYEYTLERKPQNSVGGTLAVSDLNLTNVQKFAFE